VFQEEKEETAARETPALFTVDNLFAPLELVYKSGTRLAVPFLMSTMLLSAEGVARITPESAQLRDSAKAGNVFSVYALRSRSVSGDETARYALQTIDPKIFRERADGGDLRSVNALLVLAEFDNTAAVTEIRNINVQPYVEGARGRDAVYLDVVGNIARWENKRAVVALALIAENGSEKAVRYLRKYARTGNGAAHDALKTLNVDRLVENISGDDLTACALIGDLAGSGNGRAFRVLAQFAAGGSAAAVRILDELSDEGLSEARKVLQSLDPKTIGKNADNGDVRAVSALTALMRAGNEKAGGVLRGIDPSRYVEKANAGDVLAVQVLQGLIDYAVEDRIPRALGAIRAAPFLKMALEGNEGAVDALSTLVLFENDAALRALCDLVSAGNEYARRKAQPEFHKRVLTLRIEHLERGVSGDALRKRLRELCAEDYPYLLYGMFTSEENYGDLAGMIYQELDARAKAKGADMHTYVSDIDPRRVLYRAFVLQCANFNLLGRMFSKPSALYEIMDETLKNLSENEISLWSLRLGLFVEDVLYDKEFPYQKEFQAYLRSLYDGTKGANRHLVATLLATYKDALRFCDKADIERIQKENGIEIRGVPVPYADFYKDGELVAHLVFADHDAVRGHYDAAVRYFHEKGYKEITRDGTKAVLKKGDAWVVFFKADARAYDIDTHIGKADIISSRSHAGGEEDVFKTQTPARDDAMLGFLSACRSATKLGWMAKNYTRADFVGVKNVAYGAEANRLTYHVLEGLSRRIPTYQDLNAYVWERLPGAMRDNYILPGAPVYSILNEMKRYLGKGRVEFAEDLVPDEEYAGQIGKEYRITAVREDSGNGSLVLDVTGRVSGETRVVTLGMSAGGPAVNLERIAGAAEKMQDVIGAVLGAFPKNVDVRSFTDLDGDLFGFSLGDKNMIAFHESVKDDPVAQFHEIAEYLNNCDALRLRLDETGDLEITVGNNSFTAVLSDESRAVASKNGGSSHYMIRALAREAFGSKDRALTRRIKNEQTAASVNKVMLLIEEGDYRQALMQYRRTMEKARSASHTRQDAEQALGLLAGLHARAAKPLVASLRHADDQKWEYAQQMLMQMTPDIHAQETDKLFIWSYDDNTDVRYRAQKAIDMLYGPGARQALELIRRVLGNQSVALQILKMLVSGRVPDDAPGIFPAVQRYLGWSGVFQDRVIQKPEDIGRRIRLVLHVLYAREHGGMTAEELKDLEDIYWDDDFIAATGAMSSANQFSIARAVRRTLKESGCAITGGSIRGVLPFILQANEAYARRTILDKNTHVLEVRHSRMDTDRQAAFKDFGHTFHHKEVVSFTGSAQKQAILAAIRESPEKTTIWIHAHGEHNHIWLGDGPDIGGLDRDNRMDHPEGISCVEFAGALRDRAGRHNGKLGDMNIVADSCYSSDFAANTLAQLEARGVEDLPVIIATAHTGVHSFGERTNWGGLSSSVLVKALTLENDAPRSDLTVGDIDRAEEYASWWEDFVFFLPVAADEFKRLKARLGVAGRGGPDGYVSSAGLLSSSLAKQADADALRIFLKFQSVIWIVEQLNTKYSAIINTVHVMKAGEYDGLRELIWVPGREFRSLEKKAQKVYNKLHFLSVSGGDLYGSYPDALSAAVGLDSAARHEEYAELNAEVIKTLDRLDDNLSRVSAGVRRVLDGRATGLMDEEAGRRAARLRRCVEESRAYFDLWSGMSPGEIELALMEKGLLPPQKEQIEGLTLPGTGAARQVTMPEGPGTSPVETSY
jgi:hypothetical protein